MLEIEVAYAGIDSQSVIALRVPFKATIREAIELSGILKHYPEINLEVNKVGIFGQINSLEDKVAHQDRVEIYRALYQDPMLARKERAKKSKNLRKF